MIKKLTPAEKFIPTDQSRPAFRLFLIQAACQRFNNCRRSMPSTGTPTGRRHAFFALGYKPRQQHS
jgi:hypothetical protein